MITEFTTKDETKIEIDDIPFILIKQNAQEKINQLVDIADDEISWFGSVLEIKDGMRRIFVIDEIYLPEQEVSATSADFSTDDMVKLADELLELPDGIEIVNRLRYWGHSHVHMSIGPSATDTDQMESFSEDMDYMIMGIYNKDGECRLDINFFKDGFKVINAPWKVLIPDSDRIRKTMEKLVNKKVKKKKAAVGYWKNNKFISYDKDNKKKHKNAGNNILDPYGYGYDEYGNEYNKYDNYYPRNFPEPEDNDIDNLEDIRVPNKKQSKKAGKKYAEKSKKTIAKSK